MKKTIPILTAFLVCILLPACGGPANFPAPTSEATAEKNSYYPVTLSNYNSQKEKIDITFKKAPQKVFALHQNSIETLLALGLTDNILACAGDIPPIFNSEHYEYYSEFKKVKYLGFANETGVSLEELVAMNPDFILGWKSTFAEQTLGTTPFWHERGVNTYIAENSNDVVSKKTIENEFAFILDMGKIFDRTKQATAIVQNMDDEMKRIIELTKNQKHPKTMVIELENDMILTYGAKPLSGELRRNY